MKIKEELIKACGERSGEIFSNTQGPVNPMELRASLNFKEIVEINAGVNSQSFERIAQHCEENNLQTALEFLNTFRKFINSTYQKNASLALIEENYGNTQYKTLIKGKSVEVYGSDKKNFNNETVRQIKEIPNVATFFKEKVLNSADATEIKSEDLKEKIALLAQVGIMNAMMKKFKFLREKPLAQFERYFSEDSGNMTTSVFYDIQQNGLI